MNYVKCLTVVNVISVCLPLIMATMSIYYNGSWTSPETINYSNKVKPFMGKFFWGSFIDLIINFFILYDKKHRMELNIGVRNIFNESVIYWNIISSLFKIYIFYILYNINIVEGEIIYKHTFIILIIYKLLTIIGILCGYKIYKNLLLYKR